MSAELEVKMIISPVSVGSGADHCSNTCHYASDGDCDDGGAGAEYNSCSEGSDCYDYGSHEPAKEAFARVSLKAEMYAPFYNWGRPKEIELHLTPWNNPPKNSYSCNHNKHGIKESRNDDPKLFWRFLSL